jgi:hydrogenase maturation protease
VPEDKAYAASTAESDEQVTGVWSPAPYPASLIIGLGSPLRGDDGVGVRVVEALAKRTLPADVEVVDGGAQGLGLVSLMEGRRRVVFVDAADLGQAPGQFVRFTFDEVRSGSVRLLGDEHSISVHAAGLRDALLLAQALGCLPDETIIFGVQPASIDWEQGLSPQIEAVLPRLVEAVLAEAEAGSQT